MAFGKASEEHQNQEPPELDRGSDSEVPCFPWVMALPGRGQVTQHSCLMTENQNSNNPVFTH